MCAAVLHLAHKLAWCHGQLAYDCDDKWGADLGRPCQDHTRAWMDSTALGSGAEFGPCLGMATTTPNRLLVLNMLGYVRL
jgi:hypothetical protein